MSVTHVTCDISLKLQKDEAKDHVIIDLRDVTEFDAGHIKDSMNIPHKELQANIETLIPNKEKRVIVIVGPTQDTDLKHVHDLLDSLGYKSVEFLAGGFDQFCEIAPLEIEPELTELTPEESGFVGHGGDEEPLDPHVEEDESIS